MEGGSYLDVEHPALEDFIVVTTRFDHNLGVESDGTVVAWESNDDGQCDRREVGGRECCVDAPRPFGIARNAPVSAGGADVDAGTPFQ